MNKSTNDVYKYICEQEGLKQQVTIGQVREILRVVVDMLLTEQDLGHVLLGKYARGRKTKLDKKKKAAK